MGWLFGKLGQPAVIGEIIAGIVLGPSLFGLIWPDLQSQFFPPASSANPIPVSMNIMYVVSQLGLVLYMFTVGLELKVELVQQQMKRALAVGFAGIVAPMLGGSLLAWWLITDSHKSTFFGPVGGSSNLSSILFTGTAMSITAFPVLARIIQERGLTHTALGNLSLTTGSLVDVLAWCMLAIILATLRNDLWVGVVGLGGGFIYVVLMLWVSRPLLAQLAQSLQTRQGSSGFKTFFGIILLLLILSAWFTETLGLHAVFGAFMLGAILPRGEYTQQMLLQIEPLTTKLLVPLFFVYSGLNTHLNLVDSSYLWLIELVVLLIAFLGKAGACWLAARLTKATQQEALGIGILMNTRGLVELILLNIGLEQQIITPAFFTILVIMAIITTFATIPLFNLVYNDSVSSSVQEQVVSSPLT
jgi:Kef-type K+ transport system membrane component KefB